MESLGIFLLLGTLPNPPSCGFVICSVIISSPSIQFPVRLFSFSCVTLNFFETPNQSWNTISQCQISVEKLKIKLILVNHYQLDTKGSFNITELLGKVFPLYYLPYFLFSRKRISFVLFTNRRRMYLGLV